MTASKIEWTERSDWNPVRGCTRVSEGCRHCYAEALAGRFSDPGQWGHGFAKRLAQWPVGESGFRWTGRVELIEERLTLPLRWRKPALIFASSTSDLFHESLPDEAIDCVFAVMALAPQHRFQVLTKRSARMRDYLSGHVAPRIWRAARELHLPDAAYLAITAAERRTMMPLPNVWLGVSVEDQAAAEARVPDLLATSAALRFLSCEPLLGPVWVWHELILAKANRVLGQPANGPVPGIDWVIAGGESGRGARPMHPDWVRSLRDQCAGAGVPFFFKQWGEWGPDPGGMDGPGGRIMEGAGACAAWRDGGWAFADDGFAMPLAEGADIEWLYRLGKGANGRLLDGVPHSGMPA